MVPPNCPGVLPNEPPFCAPKEGVGVPFADDGAVPKDTLVVPKAGAGAGFALAPNAGGLDNPIAPNDPPELELPNIGVETELVEDANVGTAFGVCAGILDPPLEEPRVVAGGAVFGSSVGAAGAALEDPNVGAVEAVLVVPNVGAAGASVFVEPNVGATGAGASLLDLGAGVSALVDPKVDAPGAGVAALVDPNPKVGATVVVDPKSGATGAGVAALVDDPNVGAAGASLLAPKDGAGVAAIVDDPHAGATGAGAASLLDPKAGAAATTGGAASLAAPKAGAADPNEGVVSFVVDPNVTVASFAAASVGAAGASPFVVAGGVGVASELLLLVEANVLAAAVCVSAGFAPPVLLVVAESLVGTDSVSFCAVTNRFLRGCFVLTLEISATARRLLVNVGYGLRTGRLAAAKEGRR